jgi:hypothetical protein
VDTDDAGGNAMPRGARLDAAGTLQHVMAQGIDGKRIVMDDRDRKNLMDRMGDLAVDTDTVIYTWALQKPPASWESPPLPLRLP